MGLIDNIERGLEKAVRGVFSTGSKKRLEPVDLASRMRSEMDNKAYVIAEGRTIAPNVFTIEFSETDFPRAQDWGQDLAEELCDVAIRHARAQGYTLRGAVRVTFTRSQSDELRPGEFLVISGQERSGRHPADHEGQARGSHSAHSASSDQQHYQQEQHPNHPSPVARQATQAPRSGEGQATDAAPPVAPAAAAAASSGSISSSGSSRVAPRVPSNRGGERTGASRRPATPNYKPVLDINGQRFSIQARSIVLGRSSDADITVEDTGVSRHHLEILNQDGIFLAVDLGSTNGSFVDGTRLDGRRELVDGSIITMGRTKITFRLLAPRRGNQWPQS